MPETVIQGYIRHRPVGWRTVVRAGMVLYLLHGEWGEARACFVELARYSRIVRLLTLRCSSCAYRRWSWKPGKCRRCRRLEAQGRLKEEIPF